MLIPSPHTPGEAKAVVSLRLYWPGQSTCYAAIWTQCGEHHSSGTGKAGGGGYDKKSAAAAEAIRNAGWELSEDIDGRGQSAIREAVKAMAVAAGFPDALYHTANP